MILEELVCSRGGYLKNWCAAAEEDIRRTGVQQQGRTLEELVCSSRGGYLKNWCVAAEEDIRRTGV